MEKPSSIQIIESVNSLFTIIRDSELENKGSGYRILEDIKNDIPPAIYDGLKIFLDKPNLNLQINVNFKKD